MPSRRCMPPQPPYNLFERGIEADILPYCRRNDIATPAYGPLCRGLLSGRITEDTRFSGDDIRQQDPKFRTPRPKQYVAAVQYLDRFAGENYGRRLIHLAMRWVLDRDGITFALWGARRPDQLGAVSEIADWQIDASAMHEIDRIVASCITESVGHQLFVHPIGFRGLTRGPVLVTFRTSSHRVASDDRSRAAFHQPQVIKQTMAWSDDQFVAGDAPLVANGAVMCE